MTNETESDKFDEKYRLFWIASLLPVIPEETDKVAKRLEYLLAT